jgi:hypothetical protein
MELRYLSIAGAAVLLVGCGQSGGNMNQAAAAQPKPKKVAYCFFKDAETKGWSASRNRSGNIVVKGKAYRSDSRYQAVIGKIEVEPPKAIVWPTIQQNGTGFGAPENWWDVTAEIPNSVALDTVDVNCGPKTFAELKIPLKD